MTLTETISADYEHLARNSVQTAAARITGSIGANLSSAQSLGAAATQ